MKINTQKKVYKITYGTTSFETDARKKELKNSDSLNVDSITVVAEDVYTALANTDKVMLEKEKMFLKEDEQIFVESVELVAVLDDIA